MKDWKEHWFGNVESEFKVQFIKETVDKSLHFQDTFLPMFPDAIWIGNYQNTLQTLLYLPNGRRYC